MLIVPLGTECVWPLDVRLDPRFGQPPGQEKFQIHSLQTSLRLKGILWKNTSCGRSNIWNNMKSGSQSWPTRRWVNFLTARNSHGAHILMLLKSLDPNRSAVFREVAEAISHACTPYSPPEINQTEIWHPAVPQSLGNTTHRSTFSLKATDFLD